MNDLDFRVFQDVLKKDSGLVVTAEKLYLLESRLRPVARSFGFDGLSSLAQALRFPGDDKVRVAVVEAMTTNETSFFRDATPFQALRETVLPFFAAARPSRALRIWSAACASGQEPYSIAMLLRDQAESGPSFQAEILATDISGEILAQAQAGIYSQFEVQRGLPIQALLKYFSQIDGGRWQAGPEIRNMVAFRRANLLHDLGGLGVFDVIFCRNVLIYFDVPTKARVLAALKERLAVDGVLFLGGAETVLGVSDAFRPHPSARGVYVRNDSPHLLAQGKEALSKA